MAARLPSMPSQHGASHSRRTAGRRPLVLSAVMVPSSGGSPMDAATKSAMARTTLPPPPPPLPPPPPSPLSAVSSRRARLGLSRTTVSSCVLRKPCRFAWRLSRGESTVATSTAAISSSSVLGTSSFKLHGTTSMPSIMAPSSSSSLSAISVSDSTAALVWRPLELGSSSRQGRLPRQAPLNIARHTARLTCPACPRCPPAA
mmetsp:Transcript_24973/g.69655  ORF Transcript_24973/g.69655 Transcript_24973/m.69655 type:complete len:202 (+) Transcript_24973:882-1487(+)